MIHTNRPYSLLTVVVVGLSGIPALSGCGGAGKTLLTPVGSGTGSSTASAVQGTARFHVDVKTGQVTVTPLNGGRSASGRAILSGSAVTFASSTLLDQSGDVGLKALNVTITNNWGLPIGTLPASATPTGLKLLFSNFTNANTAASDLRSTTTVSAFAGVINASASQDGPLSSAQFHQPSSVVADGNHNLYVSEWSSIRKVSNSAVSTLAGSDQNLAETDGTGRTAAFNRPTGMALTGTGDTLIIADYGGHRIRRVTLDGSVTTIAGTGMPGSTDGPGNVASFNNPYGVTIASDGAIYVSEYGGNRIRKITPPAAASLLQASNYTVTTLAGNGAAGMADGVGSQATFSHPLGLAADGATPSNLIVLDSGNQLVRRVSLNGEVATIAGKSDAGVPNGPGAANGDGTTASFNMPYGIVALQSSAPFKGNASYANYFVIGDLGNNLVRLLYLPVGGSNNDPHSWQVATLAGRGAIGSATGSGTVASFNGPQGVGIDATGNIVVVDYLNSLLRKVTSANGFFVSSSGSGTPSSELVQLSNASGYLPQTGAGQATPYILVSTVLAAGATTTTTNISQWNFVVPNGVTAFEFVVTVEANTGALAPPQVAQNAGSPQATTRTLAGSITNQSGQIDGPAIAARFNQPMDVVVDQAGNAYVADFKNNSIRRIDASGTVSTVAGIVGKGAGTGDGLGIVAQFSGPVGITITSDGKTLYVADYNNNKIRMITLTGTVPTDPASWTVSTIAGTGTAGFNDGTGDSATLAAPTGVVLVGSDLYVTEGNRIRHLQYRGNISGSTSTATMPVPVAVNWQVTLLAGDNNPTSPPVGLTGSANGTGSAARFYTPFHLTADRQGNLYVADAYNHQIRKVTPDGTVTTIAGSSPGYADGQGTAALFKLPEGITIDSAGYLYVSEANNSTVRRISPSGMVMTIAGKPRPSGTPVGPVNVDGTGDLAQFGTPEGMAIDASGNLFVTDMAGQNIRLIERIINTGQN
jgi:sugar lactone lactonase YvrE